MISESCLLHLSNFLIFVVSDNISYEVMQICELLIHAQLKNPYKHHLPFSLCFYILTKFLIEDIFTKYLGNLDIGEELVISSYR